MKIWKMVGCLCLLCVIICACVAMGKRTEVAAAAPDPEGETEANAPISAATVSETGDSLVLPTYSEGLRFRSNGDGTCALAGMGSCTSACLLIPPKSPAGDLVTEILPYALSESIVGAIEIPATVETLSAASFAGCRRLSYVRVAAGNPAYLESDGVLYTADGATLVYCPCGRAAADLPLSASLRRVAAGAFAECRSLTTVTFGGTTSEWHNVIVGDDNDPLFTATFRFSASGT